MKYDWPLNVLGYLAYQDFDGYLNYYATELENRMWERSERL